jgi:F-type H+-transporting ATPase subunit epsilon
MKAEGGRVFRFRSDIKMADKIELEVVTPERRVLGEPVEFVTVPGLNGELGILPGHTPLISQLQTGVLTYFQDGKSSQLHVSGGFVEVRDDHVAVLADVAERPEEIDAAVARATHDRLEKQLTGWSGSEDDLENARIELARSEVRLQLASTRT